VLHLGRLRYFLAVAKERNFTRAAQQLHLAQPALSRQVRALERELGVELLRRTTHEVVLTEAGRVLVQRGPALLAEADEVERAARAAGKGEAGTAVVAYGTSVGYETAPRLLAVVAERLPGLRIETRVLPLAAILEGVAAGTLDAGLVRCPPEADGVEQWVIRREQQGALMPAGHPLAAAERVELAALAAEPLLLHPREANPRHYDTVVDLVRDAGAEPDVVLRDVAFDAAHAPVAGGRAVAIVGASAGALAPPGTIWRPLDPETTIDIALVARRRDRPPAAERLAKEILSAAAALHWA
jgi:DNA-binding transcriptional LysR family regulator